MVYASDMVKRTPLILIILAVLAVVAMVAFIFRPRASIAPTVNTAVGQNVNAPVPANSNTNSVTKQTISFATADLPDRDPHFNFTAEIPKAWQVDTAGAGQSLNFLDAKLTGSRVDRSKVWVDFYTANGYQPLPVAVRPSVKTATVAKHAAETYVVPAGTAITSAAGKPSWWRNARTVTEIQATTDLPHIMYVFNFAPTMSESDQAAFLSSLDLPADFVQP